MIEIPNREYGASIFRIVLPATIIPVISDILATTLGETAFSFSGDAKTIASAALALNSRLI